MLANVVKDFQLLSLAKGNREMGKKVSRLARCVALERGRVKVSGSLGDDSFVNKNWERVLQSKYLVASALLCLCRTSCASA